MRADAVAAVTRHSMAHRMSARARARRGAPPASGSDAHGVVESEKWTASPLRAVGASPEFNTPQSENTTNFRANAQEKAATRGGQRGALQFSLSFPSSQRNPTHPLIRPINRKCKIALARGTFCHTRSFENKKQQVVAIQYSIIHSSLSRELERDLRMTQNSSRNHRIGPVGTREVRNQPFTNQLVVVRRSSTVLLSRLADFLPRDPMSIHSTHFSVRFPYWYIALPAIDSCESQWRQFGHSHGDCARLRRPFRAIPAAEGAAGCGDRWVAGRGMVDDVVVRLRCRPIS